MPGLILAGKKYDWLVIYFIYQPFWLVSQKVNFEPCPRHIPDFQASFQKVLCKTNNSAKQNSGYNSAAIQLTR